MECEDIVEGHKKIAIEKGINRFKSFNYVLTKEEAIMAYKRR